MSAAVMSSICELPDLGVNVIMEHKRSKEITITTLPRFKN